ncbi:MAG: hypothetical protein M3159_01825, partial [Actinomycetota bacterium]|nr:hypothetical protein [Actinomycetota bacterium]
MSSPLRSSWPKPVLPPSNPQTRTGDTSRPYRARSVTSSFALILVLLVATACQVTVGAEVDAKADGTGVVRAAVALDAQAAQGAPDLGAQLRVDDLRQAGWTVRGPTKESDGLTWVRASKPFSTPARATAILGELTGPQGPFRTLTLTQSRSLLKSRT